MRDVLDFEKRDSEGDQFKKFGFSFAMHKLEVKPATLQVNLLVNCQSVTQYMHMPLLRLIHQFVTMVRNMNEMRVKLKQGHSNVDWIGTHRKQDSKGSSSSAETVHSIHSAHSMHSETSRTGLGRAGKNYEPTLSSSQKNLVAESQDSGTLKPHRSRSSIPKFIDTIRPERLSFPNALKKTHIKNTIDVKKGKL